MLLVCRHCWTTEQIAKEYPELAKYPVSDRLCEMHFQLLMTRALEMFPVRGPKHADADQPRAANGG